MTLQELIDGKKWKELMEALTDKRQDSDAYRSEYNGKRDIRDDQIGKRKDKETDAGPVSVNQIPVQFQKKIVRMASSFLFGSPVELEEITPDTDEENAESDENTPFQELISQWDGLRLDSLLLKLAETVKSETKAAILFRAIADGETAEEEEIDIKLKATLLTEQNDAKLFPGIDEFGDMLVFGYQIKVKNSEGKDVNRIYLYFDENVQILEDDGKDLKEVENKPHFFKRIPVVYVSQAEPDWWDVKELIDRFEMNFSKFCDTNDYFASPFFKAVGTVDEAPQKDDSGKVYMMDIIETDSGKLVQSDLDVISWEQATDAVKLELETGRGLIFDLTDTPDLTFDNVKGLGNISGFALNMMFLSPLLKAKYSEATYKTAVERVVNVLRAGMVHALRSVPESFFKAKIKVNFTNPLPTNAQEMISMLSEAVLNKPIMSQETAIGLNPFVEDATREKEKIDSESSEGLGDSLDLNG